MDYTHVVSDDNLFIYHPNVLQNLTYKISRQ